MADWTVKDMPSQEGRIAVVTGTGGLGFETALALAGAGADVTLAGRNAEKGAASVAAIRERHPDARIAFEELDLADLDTVAAFARRIARLPRIDLLINNAGVMAPPERRETKQGFELQFGTNHLGHFALTAHLLPLLLRGDNPRLVSVSSSAARMGGIHFEDINWERSYRPWASYCSSKRANLVFAVELQRRRLALGWNLVSTAAHPGFARTELIPNGPGGTGFQWWVSRNLMMPWMSQSPAEGALPTLMAATAPHVEPGGFYGPSHLFEMKGPPKLTEPPREARDQTVADRLWDISERLTGTSFPGSTLTALRHAS